MPGAVTKKGVAASLLTGEDAAPLPLARHAPGDTGPSHRIARVAVFPEARNPGFYVIMFDTRLHVAVSQTQLLIQETR